MADTMFSVLFKPLSLSSFRWQGEFTPQVRGPQAYLESAPLPLPSTVAGALAGKLLEVNGTSLCSEKCRGSADPYCSVREGLRLIADDVKLRGPFLYVESRSGGGGQPVKIVCFYLSARSLLCISETRSQIMENQLPQIQAVGIALDNLAKSTIEGYMYTAVMADLNALAEMVADRLGLRGVIKAGILVEIHSDKVHADILEKLNDATVSLGGEQKPVVIEVIKGRPVYELLEELLNDGRCAYWHIVSPILLCGNWYVKVEDKLPQFLGNVIEKAMGLQPCGHIKEAVLPDRRLRFSAIGLGYSYCRPGRNQWTEGHRPYCAAIMPGSGILASTSEWKARYKNGTGSYSDLGWGTLIPLPSPQLKSSSN